jgi:hypothetical protein
MLDDILLWLMTVIFLDNYYDIVTIGPIARQQLCK